MTKGKTKGAGKVPAAPSAKHTVLLQFWEFPETAELVGQVAKQYGIPQNMAARCIFRAGLRTLREFQAEVVKGPATRGPAKGVQS